MNALNTSDIVNHEKNNNYESRKHRQAYCRVKKRKKMNNPRN